MPTVESMEKFLEERGLTLYPDLHFENDCGRNVIILCDERAETIDEYFLFEAYSEQDLFDFLKREKLVEIICN
ncbi:MULTISPECIES: hypothetical protein [Heyndrickxia]|uniref:hypothetical protein n=1 Tax=Heyndrickxia TaxID=2837504 RepID=UPI002DBA3189|nr:hypothetical protein [Weizmannia sp. CD-2023]MEC2225022.1 hypothetical protein [Weizmannia sp. CD-2023]